MGERGLFRWAGAKRHLIERVKPLVEAHLAATGGRLISCFHGSGAIERACGGAAIAADASPELLMLFAALRADPDQVHRDLVALDARTDRTPEAYKALGLANKDPLYAYLPVGAARFLWLSAMAFNGVWRVNGKGQMNMGVDRARLARRDVLPGIEAFRAFAAEIHSTRFVFGWQTALAAALPGDLALVDSPYGAFDGYTAAGFGSRDHRLLASALKEEAAGGVAVIAFNAPEAASIYHWAHVEEVTRSGCVSSKATDRDPVAELIITAGLQSAEACSMTNSITGARPHGSTNGKGESAQPRKARTGAEDAREGQDHHRGRGGARGEQAARVGRESEAPGVRGVGRPFRRRGRAGG